MVDVNSHPSVFYYPFIYDGFENGHHNFYSIPLIELDDKVDFLLTLDRKPVSLADGEIFTSSVFGFEKL